MSRVLKSKKDIEQFLDDFVRISLYDEQGNKHYFVFEDKKRNGQWALMLNEGTKIWTIHGKSSTYCDPGEQVLESTEIVQFIWKNRGSVNKALRQKMEFSVEKA
ncbi:hypothetical protein RRU94_02170 [Domibacillus sp. DTU_2020_1001157_1_SI_ALB_TIR_016]|uniref:hypothetical protein n=1 Tax=Domibacillus sp. DTU_2020_1001157_1_SI_ALB_TIR_016 TaxID=3077789 RepID=UPI0028EB8979|nr:hypothetical protein [Domibacillus sp. DTU_2020_1001157_1_SI_ALB_TIR_016]WNS78774.1 hypothetical protein RRU94_02170 [Domibacillus sp. DTU_2020_1001157_1_SI_ALB_TIR_016]